jgi:hypothetical protein
MNNRKGIRLLAAVLALAMAISLLAVPASAASANTALAQTGTATQDKSDTGLKAKAAMGALGMGAMVYFYWHPAARQKASNVAQLVLSDAVSDVLLLLGDAAAGAKRTFSGAATDAKEEKSRVKGSYTAKENEETIQTAQDAELVQDAQTSKNVQTAQDAQTTETETLRTETQSAAKAQDATTSAAEDTDEPVQVIIKLGSAYAAKAES